MMILSTQVYIVTFFFSIIIGLFVFFNNKKSPINRLFCLLSLSLGLWILSNIFVNLIKEYSIFFVRIAIIWVALLPILFSKFVKHLYFTNNPKYERKEKIIFYFSLIITSYIIIFSQTKINVKSISFESWGVNYEPGQLYIILFFYLLITFGFSFFYLYKIYTHNKSSNGEQAGFILLGALLTLILSLFTNIIFPLIGYGFFNIFGPTTTLIFLSFIAYSITKHHLFNIKIIMVEVVIFGLWIMMLTRLILAKTWQDIAIESSLLTITVIFGIMLIRSVFHEIHQRIHIEKLAEDIKTAYAKVREVNENLEEKISEQTKEIRRAYEVEKEARTKLEKLNKDKDKFITSTQHHLRTPLTSLKWELESMRKNSEKLSNTELDNSLLNVDESISNMSNIIENFIKITEKN